jgi:hypothetical protein
MEDVKRSGSICLCSKPAGVYLIDVFYRRERLEVILIVALQGGDLQPPAYKGSKNGVNAGQWMSNDFVDSKLTI